MRGRYQGGSLAGFIIVGILLALVVIGGLYGLNRYNAEHDKKVATSSNDKTKSSDTKKTDSTKPRSSTPTDTDSTESQPSTPPASSDETATGTANSNSHLPTTGPEMNVFSIIAIGLLSFAGAHYLRSRQRT
jgi:uncharacterized surface anchored protein